MDPSACEQALRAVVVGGGPAGLMAAETLAEAGITVDLYDAMGSVGRKFLLAGKGGLNLTHSEAAGLFAGRYRERADAVARWLATFDNQAMRDWARSLGVETVVGSSGRVFPADHKAAPLLRAWVRRLRASGVRLHPSHRCIRLLGGPRLEFVSPQGPLLLTADVVVLALGGGSWPRLGSDGEWVSWLSAAGVALAPLRASNCGFETAWSAHMSRYAGAPLKPVTARWKAADGGRHALQGECVVTSYGLEGGLIYAASADLRETIARDGSAELELDLLPGRTQADLEQRLQRARRGRSLSEHLRRSTGLTGVRAGLLFECTPPAQRGDAAALAAAIKALPLRLLRARPLAEAISTAGGVRLEALDERLMVRRHPGVFCAGEMLDWEAPTGGYLLQASFASGRVAGRAAAQWLASRNRAQSPYNGPMSDRPPGARE
jgi:uncharacterized flavoprotein (TIGR03862 family)